MQFTSLAYLGFFAAVFAVHWAVPQKARWAVCLAASAGFYALLGAPMLAVLALCIAVSYLGGLWLQRRRGRRPALALAAAACLVLIATAALVMHRTPETDIYIDGTALSADPVPIDQPMPMALDGRSTDVQTLCLSLSFESRTDALLEVSVSEGVLDSPSDASPRALSARSRVSSSSQQAM